MNGMIKGGLVLSLLLAGGAASASEYLVKYRSHSMFNLNSFANAQVQVMDHHEPGQLVKVDIANKDRVAGLVSLMTNPNVEYVVPNARVHTFSAPIEASALKEQYALAKVQAEKAWQRAGNKGSRKIVVAVIDTGTDYRHESLAPNAVPGYDFAGNDNDPMDETGGQNPGHGTHCSGIIGGTGLVDNGIQGLSPEVSIMPLRFLDKNGSGDLNNGIKAIDYAIEKKVDLISASWGAAVSQSQAQPLIDAVKRAEAAGIVFVVAAANDGKNNDSYEVYPANASLSNTIAVAASNSSDSKPSWSNYGKMKVNLAAPGENIMSTLPGNKYGNLSGTSMATPLVAGLVALVKAQDNTLKPMEIRSLLQATGTKVGIQTACDCRIDAYEAVETVLSKKMFVSPYATTIGTNSTQQFTGVYGKAPFTFASSNTAVATIDANGLMTGLKEGETTVTVTDSAGVSATSYKIYVGKPTATPPGPGEPPPGGGGDCPLGDQALCDAICQMMPDLPFCK